MGETHGGFECKYGVHDPQLRVEQVMDFFLRGSKKKKNADGSIRRGGLGLTFFDLYSLGLPTFGR